MNLIIKIFLAILCIGCVNYLLIYYSDGYFNSSYKETILFIDTIFTWGFCFIFIYTIFYTIKKIYYGNDKCKNFIFDSAIPIIVMTVISKILLISFLRSLNLYGIDVLIGLLEGAIIASILLLIYNFYIYKLQKQLEILRRFYMGDDDE